MASNNQQVNSDYFPQSTIQNGNPTVQNLATQAQGVELVVRPFYPQGPLKEFLSSDGDGKEVLKSYKNHNNRLTKNIRSKLVRIVIKRDTDYILQEYLPGSTVENLVISSERLQFLAAEICTIFEGEVPSTFYYPGYTEGDVSVDPGGKLYHHLSYRRTKFKENGVLQGNNNLQSTDNLVDQLELNETDIDMKIQWLNQKLDPWDTVLSYWKDTYQKQRKILKDENTTVDAFCDRFPCLKVNEGSNLLKQDFHILYPERENVLNEKWHIMKSCIIEELKLKSIKNDRDRALNISLKTLPDKNQDSIVLHLLPYVISPFAPKRKRKDNSETIAKTKETIEDRRSQFFVNVQNAADANTLIEHIKDALRQKGQTFQPMIVGVGDLENPNQFLVYVNDFGFQFDTCLKALDAALKIYFALDCQYPTASASMWTFFQKCGLNINLPSDRKNSSMDILIGRIQTLTPA